MTKKNITNRHLLMWDIEINNMEGSIMSIFNHHKIKEFYNTNGVRVQSIKEKVNKLQEEFIVIEDNKIKYSGEGSDRKPEIKEGKTFDEYKVKHEELMNEITTVEI